MIQTYFDFFDYKVGDFVYYPKTKLFAEITEIQEDKVRLLSLSEVVDKKDISREITGEVRFMCGISSK